MAWQQELNFNINKMGTKKGWCLQNSRLGFGINKGTYAGQLCEVGDLLICITAGTADVAATWTVAQTNINGYIKHKVNNVAYTVYSNDTTPFTIYAPITGGTTG